MANLEQLDILKQGLEVWNEWRVKNPGAQIDLRGATFVDNILVSTDLIDADLRGVNLNSANLICANLRGANLRGALQLHFLGDRWL